MLRPWARCVISGVALLYKLFMNSLHHFYIPRRNLCLLTICLPKLLAGDFSVAEKGSAGEPNVSPTARHGANREIHVGHFPLVQARQLTP